MFYHLKRIIAKAILECVDLWNTEHHHHHPTFKLGINVKAVLIKNHKNIRTQMQIHSLNIT